LRGQFPVSGGINQIKPGPGYGNSLSLCVQGAAMCGRVYSKRHTTGYDQSRGSELGGKIKRGLGSAGSTASTADNGYLWLAQQLQIPAGVEQCRVTIDLAQ